MENLSLAEQLIDNLLQIKAIRMSPQNPFTWASGWKSPVYCDNRKILSYPIVRDLVKTGIYEMAKNQFSDFNCIAGVATAGIAWGAILADQLNLPFVYVRSKPKEHGMKNTIEGDLPENARVLVVEDVISTGMSSLQAVDDLRTQGAQIIGMLAIYTYGFPMAIEKFGQKEVVLKTLTNYEVLTKIALKKGFIEKDVLETLILWRNNPDTWNQ
ncbi:MAG: orotate phosphoribosyltransferase [Bacteroidetes bacterium]|nr:orotate phosphoribosyltransferase [Bacteroidota bacterium]MBL0078298.1 orotate phosphoribosyltransferase [Bacteroidota bacterium]